MKSLEISIDIQGTLKKANIEYDRRQRTLAFRMEDFISKVYTGHDIFTCFGLMRADFPEIKFLCKGAKINVHPSRMSSQMSAGMVAYEMHLGRPADEDDVVRIFDYEDMDITNDIQQQQEFYKRWIDSLGLNL